MIIKIAAGVVLGYLGIVGINLAGQVVAESSKSIETDPQIIKIRQGMEEGNRLDAEFERLTVEENARECAEEHKASCK